MVSTGSFENHYDPYTSHSSSSILNDVHNGVSEKFQAKLNHFNQNKIEILVSKMESDIFYDGTVYTGSTGLALYYLTSSLKNAHCNEMLKKALKYVDINNLKGKRISFLCGDAGPLAVATVISNRLGVKRPSDLPDCKSMALRLMSLITLLNDSPDELLYGRSGYLYALLFVNKYACTKLIPAHHIEKVITKILKSGKLYAAKVKAECPLMWEWHGKMYLGGAHGMAGILYQLLQAHEHISMIEMRSFIRPTFDWLMSQQFSSGNFPSSLKSSSGDKLVQWCHGAPGFVPLCILASQVFDDDKYMRTALTLGDVVWDRGLSSKGYSICHGVSGNAYAFLQLYQATKNPKHLYRACCFMEWCAVERSGTELHRPDRPASLFEGLVGRLYLALDLTHPLDARFPGYSI